MAKEFEIRESLAGNIDFQYQNLLQDIIQNGVESTDRTGTGTRKVFGRTLKFDLADGFPLLTTKKIWFKGIKEELLWFMDGERNIRPLVQKNVNIWNEWPFQKYLAKNGLEAQFPKYTAEWEDAMGGFINKIKESEEFANQWGDLGPVYGYQWRHWKTRDGGEIDQLANAIELIKHNPDSRRIIVSAWNPEDTQDVALPPCHLLFQFQVAQDKLNCAMYQRSVDSFLGLPFNIASYGLLTELMAKLTDKKPGEVTLFLADTHLYLNHIELAKEQLKRGPITLPTIKLDPAITTLENVFSEGIKVENYNSHPAIKAQISV